MSSETVEISSTKFVGGCLAAAAALFFWGSAVAFPSWFLAVEVMATILGLFLFGSMKYRIDKNALTYGMTPVILATFWSCWRAANLPDTPLGGVDWGGRLRDMAGPLLTFRGLDDLFHADTMLFILGLTFFVAVIAQTRLLESVSFNVLQRTGGRIVPTVAALTALVSIASGILDGVSMIGLMIRTLVILLFLAKAAEETVIYAVMVSTIVTTVCGMWLAYGEPPNLIMKANLHPHLDNAFFLRYCLPAAVGSYAIVFFNVRRRLKGKSVNLAKLDILDRHTADVRFLQASRHGEVHTPMEFLEGHRETVGSHHDAVVKRLHQGVPLGEALVNERVPREKRLPLLGAYLDEKLAETLDDYYVHVYGRNDHKADESVVHLGKTLDHVRRARVRAQWIGTLSFLPFMGLLIVHAFNHEVPLFLASFAGFAAAAAAVAAIPKMRRLALKEAVLEYKEYLFLLPLFLSISLLQRTGFFNIIAQLLHLGVEKVGVAAVAYGQFWFATILSAILDNNIVADFTSRALLDIKDLGVLHLFAMAQIAGYALGGCWTHIGSAQSVVAYAFIQREIDDRYTPFQWIKAMTGVILQISVFMTFLIYGESLLMKWLG